MKVEKERERNILFLVQISKRSKNGSEKGGGVNASDLQSTQMTLYDTSSFMFTQSGRLLRFLKREKKNIIKLPKERIETSRKCGKGTHVRM